MHSVSARRDYGHADMSMVDALAVEFVCNGTPMRLNTDERVVAVQRMLGGRPVSEIARLIGCNCEEVSRIARALDGTMRCPFCNQRVFHDTGFLRRHVDHLGRRWCPQSGEHSSVRVPRSKDVAS